MLKFGEFEVDFGTGHLRRRGERVPLQEQPLQVLQALLEQPGEVVSREELRRRLWAEDVHLDYEQGLNKAVLKLRQALGDDPDSPRFIETLPRRGYRFVASLERDAPAAGSGGSALPRRPRAWRAALAVALGVSVLAVGVRLAWPTRPPGTTVTIAVLPFTIISSSSGDDPLALGMADALITRLGALERTIVRPTAAVVGYLGRATDPIGTARELAVDYVIDGTVQRDGAHLRVTARLLRSQDGQQLWSERYEDAPSSVTSMQDRVADQVAVALGARFLHRPAAPGWGTANFEAYEAYLRGRYLFERRSPDALRRAVDEFRRAARLEPEFALAYAGEVHAYGPLVTLGYEPVLPVLAHLQTTAARAHELGPDLAEVHTAVALVRSLEWDWAAEERGYRRALALNPSYLTACLWYSFLLESLSRHDEALALRQQATMLDPLSLPAKVGLGSSLRQTGDTTGALRHYEDAVGLDPSFGLAHLGLGRILLEVGRTGEAVAAFQSAGDPGSLAHALTVSGRPEAARALLVDLSRQHETGYVSPMTLAAIHAALGERDEAFRWLERAYDERAPWLMRLNVDWRLAPLRSDPRFANLVRRVGLPAVVAGRSAPAETRQHEK